MGESKGVNPMEKEVFNVKEAAEFLGFTEYSIREYCKAGKIPAKKVGGEWRFFKPDLIAWLREREEVKMIRPRRFSATELEKVGVEIINPERVMLKCKSCQQQWSPNILSGGRLPKGYWKCPNRCNWG